MPVKSAVRMNLRRTVSACLIALLLTASPTVTIAQKPLLQPGKKAIYERVLTRPGARLAATIADINNSDNPLVQAFSRLYVYEQRKTRAGLWLRVGADAKGQTILGWVAKQRTVRWKQQLTLALTYPGNRERLLFFKSQSDLQAILRQENSANSTRQIIHQLQQGGHDDRIIAIEPANFVDINERFYLLPILDHAQVLSKTGESLRLLKIASVTTPEATTRRQSVHRPFTAAVVFVIDSTISMGPYIDQTKQAITQVYERLARADVIDRVRFGLVAFRAKTDDRARNRQLSYVVRQFVDPSDVRDAGAFLRNVTELTNASVATTHFNEDALAGVVTALEATHWQAFDARYVVLITDAGALDGHPVESTTGLDARRVASIANEKQVALTVFHLKTPAGAQNHQQAEAQYRELARNSRFQVDAYIPIQAGSVSGFRRGIDTLVDAVIASVSNKIPNTPAHAALDHTEKNIRAIANALGHAMRLRYLGKAANTNAPTLFEAWISNRDFADLSKYTVEVRVLLTKNQLSDLQLILGKIVNATATKEFKPNQFFNILRSLAAQFGRNPNLARSKNATRLVDLGLFAEYMVDLPFQSDVMKLTQDTWSAWGATKQNEFLNQLKHKLRRYAHYNEDWQNWTNLSQTTDARGDFVYPVPLRDMP